MNNLSPELVKTLKDRWQEVETIHGKTEGDIPTDLARWYASETTRIGRLLAEAGWLSAGYNNRDEPNVMQWRYDPEYAQILLSPLLDD